MEQNLPTMKALAKTILSPHFRFVTFSPPDTAVSQGRTSLTTPLATVYACGLLTTFYNVRLFVVLAFFQFHSEF